MGKKNHLFVVYKRFTSDLKTNRQSEGTEKVFYANGSSNKAGGNIYVSQNRLLNKTVTSDKGQYIRRRDRSNKV